MARAPKRKGKASLKIHCQGCKDEVSAIKNACGYCEPAHLSYQRCENHTITTSGGYLVLTFHNHNGIFWVWSETQFVAQYNLICKDWNRGTQKCESQYCGKCAEVPVPVACDPHKCGEVKQKIILQVTRSRERKAVDGGNDLSNFLPEATTSEAVDATASNSVKDAANTQATTESGYDRERLSSSTYSIVSASETTNSSCDPCQTPQASASLSRSEAASSHAPILSRDAVKTSSSSPDEQPQSTLSDPASTQYSPECLKEELGKSGTELCVKAGELFQLLSPPTEDLISAIVAHIESPPDSTYCEHAIKARVHEDCRNIGKDIDEVTKQTTMLEIRKNDLMAKRGNILDATDRWLEAEAKFKQMKSRTAHLD